MFANAHDFIGRLYLLHANCDAISYVIKKQTLLKKAMIYDIILS